MKTEADKLRNSIQYGLGVMDSGSGEFKELSNKIDELFELSYLEGQSSPKIKQLEWDFYRVYYSARTPIGEYAIKEDVNYYGISNNNGCILTYNGIPLGKSHLVFDNAKAAAQADFEKRVMGCLDL